MKFMTKKKLAFWGLIVNNIIMMILVIIIWIEDMNKPNLTPEEHKQKHAEFLEKIQKVGLD